MPSLTIIYSSTSGHTEYVVETLAAFFATASPSIHVKKLKTELASPQDLTHADLLILASGTWNYGGREGQLNETMHRFLFEPSERVSLSGKRIAFISLGDDRYYHTTRCTEQFMRFLKSSGATMALIPLIIVNEPYGQEEKIRKWGEKITSLLQKP